MNDEKKIYTIVNDFYSNKIDNLEYYNLNNKTKNIIENFLLHV